MSATHPPQNAGLPVLPGMPGVPGAVPGAVPPAPGIQSFPGGVPGAVPNIAAPSMNRIKVEDSIVVVSYIAYQSNYIKKGVIKTSEASKIYKSYYKAQMELPDGHADKVPVISKVINNQGVQVEDKQVQLIENYSATRFRTFCQDDWKEMLARGYCEIVMSEAKAEYFVLKAIVPENAAIEQRASIIDKLRAKCTAKVHEDLLFVVKKSNLLGYMASALITSLKMYNDISALADNSYPDGFIIFKAKETRKGKDEPKTTYVVNYLRFVSETGEAFRATNAKQVLDNYAINRDMTEDKGKVCTDVNDIINLEKFQKLFPEVTNPAAIYGSPIDFTKNSTAFASEDERKKAKLATFVEFDERFKSIGLTEDALKELRETGGSKGRGAKPIELAKVLEESAKAAEDFQQLRNRK